MRYIFTLFFGVVVTILTNHILLAFSKNLGMRGNEVKQVRWATTTKPSLGGFAFYVVFLGIMAFLSTQEVESFIITKKQLLGIFIAVSIGFFIGFADDTYNTNPLLKFLGQFLCAIALYMGDIQISIVPNNDLLNFTFTSLWVVGLMNSINMLDNMDGIAASASTVIVLGLLIVHNFSKKEDIRLTYILVASFASLIGFLYHNWTPAKMYMGDAGSQFLGVFLAVFSIFIVWNEKEGESGSSFQFRQLVLPALLFIIPLIDTITVTIRRLLRKQSPFVGGRDHTTHHLVYFGFTEKQVAILLTLINIISMSIVVIIFINKNQWSNWITGGAALFFLFVFISFQVVYNKGKKKYRLPDPTQVEVETN